MGGKWFFKLTLPAGSAQPATLQLVPHSGGYVGSTTCELQPSCVSIPVPVPLLP